MKKTAELLSVCSFLSGLCFILGLLICCVGWVVFDHGFYLDLYDQLNLAESAGVSQEDLEDSIFMMTDYVEGKKEDLNGTITWYGVEQPTFNDRETAHMKDVRALWLNASAFRWIMLALWLILGAACYFLDRKNWYGWLASGYLQALLCFAIFLAFLGMWMFVDFTSFWISFHHIFFSNDLWSLNPLTDFMIVICPEEMFSTMILQICLRFIGILAAVGLFDWWLLKKKMPIGFRSLVKPLQKESSDGRSGNSKEV